MTMLERVGITQCLNFSSIKDGQTSCEVGANKDIFVGRNVHTTLTIPNGETIQVRDIVVLGKLTIKSTSVDGSSAKGSLVARDIFAPGHLDLRYVEINHRHMKQHKNVQQFQEELQDILSDWLVYQRETVERIGLRSILV